MALALNETKRIYMESLKSTANFTPTVWAASLVIRARVLMRVVHRRWV